MRRRPARSNGWKRGINNVASASALRADELRDAVNVDIDNDGYVRLKKGSVQRYSGTDVHSFWSNGRLALFIEGTSLKRYWPDHTATVVASGLSAGRAVSYWELNREVYWSNGAESGIVNEQGVNRRLGVVLPDGQPIAAASSFGSLPAGTYLVAVTFVSDTGEQSGTGGAATVTLDTPGGIDLTSIPQSAGAVAARLFVSSPNGDDLRFQIDIAAGVTSYLVSSLTKGTLLDTQFMTPMPAGSIVRNYQGRLLIASGQYLFYSEPMRFGLHNPRSGYLVFAEDITIVQPVLDGLFVVADRTYFYQGDDMDNLHESTVENARAYAGTGLLVEPKMFVAEAVQAAPGKLGYWMSEHGPRVGLPGGGLYMPTEDRVAYPDYDGGTSLYVKQDGIRRIVTALFGRGGASQFAATDEVQTEIIRNGIVLP